LDRALFYVKDFYPVARALCEGREDQIVALFTVIEEVHLWEEMGAGLNPRGIRELWNLECSINYDYVGASSRQGKGKAHVG
jgi:hypothetical protein